MKQNLIARSAVAAAFGLAGAAAMAGTLAANTGVVYAKQAFTSSTAAINPGVPFTFQTGVTLAGSTNVYLYLAPSAGSFGNGASATNTNLSTAGNLIGSGGIQSGGSGSNAYIGNGFIVVNLGTAAAGAASGSLITVNVPNIGSINVGNVATALGVNGSGSLNLVATLSTVNNPNAIPTTGILDTATAVMATSASAVTLTPAASTNTAQISVSALNQLVSGTTVDLGSLAFAAVSGTQANLGGANDVNVGSGAAATSYNGSTINFTVTGNFQNGSNIYAAGTADCATANLLTGSAVALNGATTSVNLSYALSNASLATGYNATTDTHTSYICYNVAGNNTIPVSNFAVSNVNYSNANFASVTSAGGNLYSLGYNGATVSLSSYLPGAFAPGFVGYVRAVNLGSTTTDVTGTLYDNTGKIVSSNLAVFTGLAPNASATIDTPTLEKNNGLSLTALQWYRLVLTGKTSNLQARSMVLTPTGALIDATATASSSGSNQ